MAILIKELLAPEDCRQCDTLGLSELYGTPCSEYSCRGGKPSSCPIIEVEEPAEPAYWIIMIDGRGGRYMCSNCRTRWHKPHKYCGHCGAKIDKSRESEEG